MEASLSKNHANQDIGAEKFSLFHFLKYLQKCY